MRRVKGRVGVEVVGVGTATDGRVYRNDIGMRRRRRSRNGEGRNGGGRIRDVGGRVRMLGWRELGRVRERVRMRGKRGMIGSGRRYRSRDGVGVRVDKVRGRGQRAETGIEGLRSRVGKGRESRSGVKLVVGRIRKGRQRFGIGGQGVWVGERRKDGSKSRRKVVGHGTHPIRKDFRKIARGSLEGKFFIFTFMASQVSL